MLARVRGDCVIIMWPSAPIQKLALNWRQAHDVTGDLSQGQVYLSMPKKQRAKLYKRRKQKQYAGRKERLRDQNKALQEKLQSNQESTKQLIRSNSFLRRSADCSVQITHL